MAFRLSTTGNGVDVAAGEDVSVGGMGLGVKVSVGASGVAVKVAERLGSSVAEAGSGAEGEASTQALSTKRIQVKIRARFMVFHPIQINFLNCTEKFSFKT